MLKKNEENALNIVKFNHNQEPKKENYDRNIEDIAIECLKKSNVSGDPEKIANEFIKIYNTLKMKTNSNLQQKIPEQTVFDDYIICLEDGKHLKMLNRHLRVYYKMTFQEYKQKWGLPIDYPCTCRNHSKVRAEIAKKKRNRKNKID